MPTVGQLPPGTSTPRGGDAAVEVDEARAGADGRAPAGDADAVQRADVDHQPGAGRVAAVAVAAAARDRREPVAAARSRRRAARRVVDAQ